MTYSPWCGRVGLLKCWLSSDWWLGSWICVCHPSPSKRFTHNFPEGMHWRTANGLVKTVAFNLLSRAHAPFSSFLGVGVSVARFRRCFVERLPPFYHHCTTPILKSKTVKNHLSPTFCFGSVSSHHNLLVASKSDRRRSKFSPPFFPRWAVRVSAGGTLLGRSFRVGQLRLRSKPSRICQNKQGKGFEKVCNKSWTSFLSQTCHPSFDMTTTLQRKYSAIGLKSLAASSCSNGLTERPKWYIS